MKRLLAALLLVASPALSQSNGWREIANGWGEIQTPPGYSTFPAPSTCTTAGQIPVFLGSPLAMACLAPGTALQVLRMNAGATGVEWAAVSSGVFEIAAGYNGPPGAATVILRYVAARAFSIPADGAGSVAVAGVAATAQSDFLLKKNGTTFLTARWAAAGTVATWVSGTLTSFASGDVLTIVAPAAPDATIASIAITLAPVLP